MIIQQLRQLFETNLSLNAQCELLETSLSENQTGDNLFQATEYLYQLANVPLQAYDALDIVGTGGDNQQLFNISTAASFIIAGCNIPVLKHGNTSVSSRSGSIDCLKSLRVHLPENIADTLTQFKKNNLSFLFAPQFYPILAKIRDARKTLALKKKRSIFNLLGPLLNPLRPTHQLIGVANPNLITTMSEALLLLKRQAFVFCCQGSDEIIPGEDMQIARVAKKNITTMQLDYKSHNIKPIKITELMGGEPQQNAIILSDILANKIHDARREVVLLNAAFANILYYNHSLEEALSYAKKSLDSGAALKALKGVQQ